MRNLAVLSLAFALVVPLFAQHGDKVGEIQHPLPSSLVIPPAPILSPREELATFKVPKGFRVELVAADPVVKDPIAMSIGPDGKIWVVQMIGFMPDVDGNNEREPVCTVSVLSDSKGDGQMDQSTVAMDKLVLPRAMGLVDRGFLVGEPMNLWYARDGKRTPVAADFGNLNNPEHNANGLMWAMDNWIYSANWTTRLRYAGDGKFRRDSTITRGQWGISQDDYGRIYYNSNSDPLRVDIIPSAYLKRNPNFAASGANVQLVPANLRTYPARVTPGINRGYKTLDEQGKEYAVTSACGPVIYRGGLFPSQFENSAFIAEPAANFIKQIDLHEDHGTIKGANAYTGTEFMSSTDERFRPVNLFNGPDGALYVVDMYRGIVQHRLYVTSYLRQQILSRGLQNGIHYGRIWRVVPDNAPPANERWKSWKRLDTASSADLVAALSNPNGWIRDTAQRLLVEKHFAGAPAIASAKASKASATRSPQSPVPQAAVTQAPVTQAPVTQAPVTQAPVAKAPVAEAFKAFVPDAPETALLKQLATDPAAPSVARLQALWTLEGIEALDSEVLAGALNDADPHVCAAAIRLSERFFAQNPALCDQVAALVESRPDPVVRLQLALSLGEAKSESGDAALRRLVERAGDQPYLADAAVSGIAGREAAFVTALVKDSAQGAAETSAKTLTYAASAALKSGHAAAINQVLALLSDESLPEWARLSLVAGVRFFLPKSPEGKLFPGNLPAEPKPLLALAEKQDTALGKAAATVLAKLRWPGKAGAEAQMEPLSAAEQALFEQGKAQFATLCAACHQPMGQGLAGLAPPLLYSKWVLGDPRILARIVLCGKVQENLTMPPWKAALSDVQIAAVLTFIRRSWGHDAAPIAPRVVAAARAATATRTDPWSDADLEDLVQELGPPR
jgi:mono/diheme cytochrome c family protein/glucose/arabinose dehydrogenase